MRETWLVENATIGPSLRELMSKRPAAMTLIALLTAVGSPAEAQLSLNLDMELPNFSGASGLPWGWIATGLSVRPGSEVTLDSTIRHGGRRSLRIHRTEGAAQPHMLSTQIDPVKFPLARRRVRLSGWIRTEEVRGGQAAVLLEQYTIFPRPTVDSMAGRGASTTLEWTRFSLEAIVDSAISELGFGVYFSGTGTAWFDDLTLEVDGRRVDTMPSVAPPPTTAEMAWLRSQVHPLRGVDHGEGDTDLAPLKALVADARVIGIGEGTHGTSEFHRFRHRAVEYLVREGGVTLVALEASQLDVERINLYVRSGEGDIDELLSPLTNVWRTKEVRDMIAGMRRFNSAGRGVVEVVGLEFNSPLSAMDSVLAFLADEDATYRSTAERAYRELRDAYDQERITQPDSAALRWLRDATEVWERVRALNVSGRQGADTLHRVRMVQYANLVRQAADQLRPANMRVQAQRDSSLVANLLWQLSQRPAETKAVALYHNDHVAKQPGKMGAYLDRVFADRYRAIALTTFEGSYNANRLPMRQHRTRRRYVPYQMFPAPQHSVEGILHRLGQPRLLLDLRAARTETAGALFQGPREFRLIGAAPSDYGFRMQPIAKFYDGLVFIDRTEPTTIVPCPTNLLCGRGAV